MNTSIKRTLAATLVVAACVAPIGCKKKQDSPGIEPRPVAAATPAPDDRAVLRQALGFAARVPSDVEGYAAGFNWGGLADAMGRHAWLKEFLSGFEAGAGADPAAATPWARIGSNPEAKQAMANLRALMGEEFFVVQAPGASARWVEWRAFLEEARVGRALGKWKKQTDPASAIREAAPHMVARLGQLEMPPMLFGFKAATARAEIDAGIEKLLAKLPPGSERSSAEVSGLETAQRIVIAADKVITPEQQIRIETQLRETLGNSGLASDAVKRLLTRRVECVIGWTGDYLILSVGTDSAHLRFAGGEAESLIALDGMRKGIPHLNHPVRAVTYASGEAIRSTLTGIEVLPVFERLRPMLESVLKTPELNEIEATLAAADRKAAALQPEKIDPAFAFGWIENGLRAEGYGGAHAAVFGSEPPKVLTGSLPEGAVLWWRAAKNLDYDRRLGAWFEEICTMGWGLWKKYGVERLPDAQRPAFAVSEQLVLPKLIELYRITRDDFAKGLGPDEGFALDLRGKVPPLPKVPPSLVDKTLLPRIAWLRSVVDPAAIDRSAASYGAVLVQALALMPPQIQMMGPLLTPVSAERDNMRFYTLPALTVQGDLVPHIAMGPELWVAGTSPDFTSAVVGSATKADPQAFPAVAHLELATEPLGDWLVTLGEAAAADPAGLLPNQQGAGTQLAGQMDSLQKIAGGIRELKLALTWRYGYENGSPRESVAVRVSEPEPASR